jgi:hypothetical protein
MLEGIQTYCCHDCLKQELEKRHLYFCGEPGSGEIDKLMPDWKIPYFTSQEELYKHRRDKHGYR